MTTPQITVPSSMPDPLQPQPNFDAVFSAALTELLTAFGQTNTVATWMNTTSLTTATNATTATTKAAEATSAAASAANARDAARAYMNYQGEYNAGTAYAVGESVKYNGVLWIKESTAGAGTTPAEGADWSLVYASDYATSSGAAQTVNLGGSKIHVSTTSASTVTYTFATEFEVASVDLIIDYVAPTTFGVGGSVYDSKSFDPSSEDATPTALAFKPDGTKMYVAGQAVDKVKQYTLSTAWDVSTASYDSVISTVSTSNPWGLFFKPDGTEMYVTTGNIIRQASLSTAWDVSSDSAGGVLNTASQDSQPRALYFSSDGAKVFVVGSSTDSVYQYSLSVPWNISTATYDSVSLNVNAQESSPVALTFSATGDKMFVAGLSSGAVFQYTLSTPWDLSTASYDATFFDYSSQGNDAYAMAFKPDGSKLYILTFSTGPTYDIFQYTSRDIPTLVFPAGLEGPTLPLAIDEKTALRIVTTDGGTSYQVISAQGGIV